METLKFFPLGFWVGGLPTPVSLILIVAEAAKGVAKLIQKVILIPDIVVAGEDNGLR